jgi:hypothetical protein
MSSILKTELKQLVTYEIGARVEDSFEEAKRGLAIFEGRQTAMLDGASALEKLLSFVDTDVTEGKIDLPTAEVSKRYIMRGVNALQNLAQQASNLRLTQAGKISGLEQTVALLKNMADAETAKLAQLKSVAAEPPPSAGDGPREVGTRPLSIKEQRLAEDLAEELAKVAPPPAAVPDPPAPVVPAVTPWVKKRRGRPPRASNA